MCSTGHSMGMNGGPTTTGSTLTARRTCCWRYVSRSWAVIIVVRFSGTSYVHGLCPMRQPLLCVCRVIVRVNLSRTNVTDHETLPRPSAAELDYQYGRRRCVHEGLCGRWCERQCYCSQHTCAVAQLSNKASSFTSAPSISSPLLYPFFLFI